MDRPKSDASLTISSQISRYILNRAREAYLHRIHTDAINERSLQVSKQFPVECTQRMMELVSFQPNQHPSTITQEHQQSPPESCRDYHPPLRTTNITPRLSAKPHGRPVVFRPKNTVKKTIQGVQGVDERRCQPLAKGQEEDQQIESMREKKQRMFELEKYFIQSEKQEKSKLRHKQSEIISHGNFTTDFNGERIEMKGVGGKREGGVSRREVDPYLMVEMATSIRQEKEENRFHIAEEQTSVKKKTYRKESSLQETKIDVANKSKLSKLSANLEAFTLKEIENFINKDIKRRKNQNINRVSKVKMPEIIPLNLMKIM